MSFPWYEPDVPEEYAAARGKREAMFERELRERASLLLRLGFSRDETRLRLTGDTRWEFELHEEPAHLPLVDGIVDEIYGARRSGVVGPPTLD